MMIFGLISGWLLCAVVTAGITFAYFAGEFPRTGSQREQLGYACLFSLLFGPIGLLVSFFLSGFCQHGWRLR